MPDETFLFGPFALIPAQRVLLEHGKPLRLGSRAMDILIALVEHCGETIDKTDLIARIWRDTTVEEGALRVHVAALRKALGDGRDGRRYIGNIPGRGYRFLEPVTRRQEPPATPATVTPTPVPPATVALATVASATGNLPASLTHLVGREATVVALAAQLSRRRLLTIVGPGGIGKTSVALSVAHAVEASCPNGAWIVELAPLPDPDLVPIALAGVLGLSLAGVDPVAGLATWLRDKQALIVLDSCEHVAVAAASLAEAVLKSAPRVRILATSREPLRAEGEWLHRLASLESPPATDNLSVEEALHYSAVRLFHERARATVDSFTLTDRDVPAVLEICRRLDGVPLALELAAARLDAFSLRDLATQLDRRFAVLTRGHRTALPRQQTLRATMDWSHDLLSEPEQTVLRRLAVFQGDFTMTEATAVASDSRITPPLVVESVANLVEKSMVVTELDHDVSFHRLLDTTRDYAWEKLDASGEMRTTRRRHAMCQRDLSEQATPIAMIRDTADWQPYSNRHIGDLRTALNWTFGPDGDITLGRALAAAATDFWLAASLLTECCDWSRKALTQLGDATGMRQEMVLQCGLGLALVLTRGMSGDAHDALTRGLEIARAQNDLEYQQRAVFGLWLFKTRRLDFRASLSFARQYEQLTADSGDIAACAAADWMVGISQSFLGEHEDAGARFQRGLDAYPAATRCRDILRFGVDVKASALSYQAMNLWLRGFPDTATQASQLAIEEARGVNHPVSLCVALAWPTSMLPLRLGDLDRASRHIAELTDHAEAHALAPYHAFGLCAKGSLAVIQGNRAVGIDLLRAGLAEMRDAQYYLFYPVFLAELALALAASGLVDDALAEIETALQRTVETDYLWFLPEALRIKGELLARQGTADGSVIDDIFGRSIDAARRQKALYWELRSATSLARFWCDHDRPQDARHLLAPVFDRFSEGFATTDLREAKSLLDQLA